MSEDWVAAGLALVFAVFGVLALIAARTSRAAVNRYRGASPEERAALERRMQKNVLVEAHMRPLPIANVVLAVIGLLVFIVIGSWWQP